MSTVHACIYVLVHWGRGVASILMITIYGRILDASCLVTDMMIGTLTCMSVASNSMGQINKCY